MVYCREATASGYEVESKLETYIHRQTIYSAEPKQGAGATLLMSG
jgi:hypothetical protein